MICFGAIKARAILDEPSTLSPTVRVNIGLVLNQSSELFFIHARYTLMIYFETSTLFIILL